MRAAYSRARPRRAAGPTPLSRASPVCTDQRYHLVLKGASPLPTGASLAPIPCSRQRCHSGVFCLSRSILGMDRLPGRRFRELALEHLDCALICGFVHLAEGSDRVVCQYPFEVGLRFADESFKLTHLVGPDRAI